MWVWIISAIAGSILGNAADSWFAETKLGIWFYGKVDQISSWTARKLNIKMLAEEEAWKKKYPNVAEKISNLDHRLKTLEQLAILTKDDGKQEKNNGNKNNRKQQLGMGLTNAKVIPRIKKKKKEIIQNRARRAKLRNRFGLNNTNKDFKKFAEDKISQGGYDLSEFVSEI